MKRLLLPLLFCCSACATTTSREKQPEPVDASTRTSNATLPAAAPPTMEAGDLLTVPDVRITHGHMLASRTAAGFAIDDPTVRGVLPQRTAPNIELRFTYRGPLAARAALGSGDASRVQIGAKLRAADGCNVVYAMLRIEPEPAIVVQVKRNPDAHTHDDCSNGGYRTVKPDFRSTVPAITAGSSHRLHASLEETQLKVWLDDAIVWRGDVGNEVLTFDGPVGFRTDNGRFDLSILQPRWAMGR